MFERTVAVVGPSVKNPQYFTSTIGASISSILKIKIDESKECRLINGDVYSGKTTSIDGYLSYSDNLLTIIPEGKNIECLVGYHLKIILSQVYLKHHFQDF